MNRVILNDKARNVARALETLDAAIGSFEEWKATNEAPEWLLEYVRQTTVIPVPLLEQEQVRLDNLMVSINTGVPVIDDYPELSDDEN